MLGSGYGCKRTCLCRQSQVDIMQAGVSTQPLHCFLLLDLILPVAERVFLSRRQALAPS